MISCPVQCEHSVVLPESLELASLEMLQPEGSRPGLGFHRPVLGDREDLDKCPSRCGTQHRWLLEARARGR